MSAVSACVKLVPHIPIVHERFAHSVSVPGHCDASVQPGMPLELLEVVAPPVPVMPPIPDVVDELLALLLDVVPPCPPTPVPVPGPQMPFPQTLVVPFVLPSPPPPHMVSATELAMASTPTTIRVMLCGMTASCSTWP